jgi:rhamnosyltransferase subunit B
VTPAARIVLTSWGSYGDLFPYLGLAIRLRALGQAPILATCSYYRTIVEDAGIEFRPFRPDVDPSATDLIRRIMDPARGSEVIVREVLIPALHDSYRDLIDASRDADLIVAHPVTFAASIVAEEQGLPWLSTVLAPLSFFSVSDFPALPPMPVTARLNRLGPWTGRLLKRLAKSMTREWTSPVQALRAERGLPPAGAPLFEGQFSPHGTLALFSRVLGQPQPDWPVHTRVTGFVPYNGPSEPLPADLEAFLDRGDPPIVFTLGTSAVGAAGTFYEESARAAAHLGRRAVLLVGKNPDNRSSGPLPAGVLAVEYASHEALFPRAAAVVHHGGVGTTSQVLRAGRPMLVVPHAHDQPDNAYRVSKLGVARVLYPARYGVRRVALHLRALLDDPRYAARADVLGRQVREEQGADAACEAILETLRSRF